MISTRYRLLPALALGGAVAALAAGCGGGGSSAAKDGSDQKAKTPSVPAGSVAVVGRETISKQELTTLLGQARRTYKTQKKTFPKAGTPAYKTLQDQAVGYLVQVAEIEQRAKDLGVRVTPKQIDDYMTQVKQQSFGGDEKSYRAGLAAQGLTEADFRKQARLQLVEQGLFAKITSKVKVTDEAIADYYAKHKSEFGQPDARTVRHILVNSKALADKLYAQLRDGGDFAKLAKKYSKDPGSAAAGGKLTVSKGQTVPQFDAVAFELKTNELSKPVKTEYGWHIIQALTPVKKGAVSPLPKVKDSIRTKLEQTKKNDAASKWVDRTTKDFCDGRIAYGRSYKPAQDSCTKPKAGATTAAAAGSTAG